MLVEENRVTLTVIDDLIDLAIKGAKFAKVKSEEIELTSVEEQ